MAPKKKSKANKLARMTEEEKLRYLQHKAAMEEEAQRRKQELILTFLKTKMDHEEAFTRLNSAKINQQWRTILRQIKCKELKEDMETMKQHFEVSLQCKNELIDNLLQDFENAEFQYSLQYQTQMETIIKFLDLHESRLSNLNNWYVQQVQEIQENDTKERENFKEEFKNQMKKLQDLYDDCKQKSEERTEEMNLKFNTTKNELQTKLLYAMVKMEESYRDEIHKIKNQYNEVLQQHKNNTDIKRAHYNILSKQDDADTAKISCNFDEISRLTRDTQMIKVKYKELLESNENEINKLKLRKEDVRKQHRKFREENEKILAKDVKKLQQLTSVSNRCIQDLKEVLKKGNSILQMVDLCKKFRDKTSDINVQKKVQLPVERTDEDNSLDLFGYPEFTLFWKEYNEMKMGNEAMKKVKHEMTLENKKLKNSLHTYLNSVRRSSSVPRKCGI